MPQFAPASQRDSRRKRYQPHVPELRVEIRPPWPFRLRGGSADGLLRRRNGSLQRLLHRDGKPVHVAVIQPAPERVIFGARAGSEPDAMWGIRRLRFTTGVDDDLRDFYYAFRDDPVIGKAVRAAPDFRVRRAPLPWEALMNAITEQLIEFERAVAIQRRMIAVLGTRCPVTGLPDAPPPATVAATAPARLAALDLAPARALTLRRAAAELAAGRVDLLAADPMPGWRRLRSIPGIGPWTLEALALYGQGHHDRLPAGDLGYLKLVGRLRTGNPRARVDEPAVRDFFEPYGQWKGLAGEYVRLAAARGLLPLSPGRSSRGPAPARRGTRSSSPARRSAAA
jgi:3-methyladenine DNA glycosylase/8-oxoguanine DNA glycosylase